MGNSDKVYFVTMDYLSGSQEQMIDNDDFRGPVKQRRCTDVTFLILKVAFTIGLLGLVGYCMAYGDLYRLLNGYDNCGNICGRINPKAMKPACRGGDFKDKKFLKYDLKTSDAVIDVKFTKRECVSNCTAYAGFTTVFNRCLPTFDNQNTEENSIRTLQGFGINSQEERSYDDLTIGVPENKDSSDVKFDVIIEDLYEGIAEDMGNIWPHIVYVCLIAFALSMFFLLMFRYAAPVIVWSSLILTVILSVAVAAYAWVEYSSSEVGQDAKSSLMIGAIIATVVAVFVVMIILVLIKRIQLVVQLFTEAAKAAASMPLIFIQPVWTFISLGVVFFLWFYFAIYIQSAGKLSKVDVPEGDPAAGYYYYKKDVAMEVTRWYNIFAAAWMSQFIIGCQHMVVAGAVSTWYFTRDKSRLGAPIWTSLSIVVRYHLGSVLLGSLLITIIATIKFLLQMLRRAAWKSKNAVLRVTYYCVKCIMKYVEGIFKLISRNAYIEIAIYGQGFCPSAKRGLRMLFNNIFSAAAVNSIGDFVLFIVKLLIVVITMIISIVILWDKQNLNYPWLLFILILVFTFLIAHTFISVFEMIIDTLFICFCEDCEMNDGISRPYFMNRGLMEFVENSKKVLKIKDREENEPSAPPAM